MLPGETCECGYKFVDEVMSSAAGWFIGTTCRVRECQHCGTPNTRESIYYPSIEQCVAAYNSGTIEWRQE